MNEKIISIIIVLMLFVSSFFLSFVGRENNLTISSENRWEAYFTDPSKEDISFNIKNNGKNGIFSWQIESGSRTVITKGKENVKGGEIRIITPEISQDILGEKIIVEIIDSDGNKENIYKILNKQK